MQSYSGIMISEIANQKEKYKRALSILESLSGEAELASKYRLEELSC